MLSGKYSKGNIPADSRLAMEAYKVNTATLHTQPRLPVVPYSLVHHFGQIWASYGLKCPGVSVKTHKPVTKEGRQNTVTESTLCISLKSWTSRGCHHKGCHLCKSEELDIKGCHHKGCHLCKSEALDIKGCHHKGCHLCKSEELDIKGCHHKGCHLCKSEELNPKGCHHKACHLLV